MNVECGKWKVNYIRDGLVDEFHEGLFVQYSKPDFKPEFPYYLRSCAKPLQATLLIDHGIELTPEELALCSGSHAGEDCHINIAKGILKKLELDESYLKCGIHSPLSRTAQDKMLLSGEKASAIHNNCSGKHLGFLAICKKMNWDLKTYDKISHPLQIEIKNKINTMCGVKTEYPMTTDGCGVPILSMPLYNMLEGFISLLKYPQIVSAIKENPYIFGGENRLDTEIIQKTDDLIAKVGAGGLCIVLNIKEKDAFVVKINDCSMEARRIAVLEYINRLGWGNIEYDDQIKTIAGKVVGKVNFKFQK
ncbi:asparaginase [bacterium]|nr:asparaginase [bacterium]